MNPSPANLFANVFVSAIGFAVFVFGKKQHRAPQLVAGLVLMVFPYFVDEAVWTLTIAGAVLVGLRVAVQNGL